MSTTRSTTELTAPNVYKLLNRNYCIVFETNRQRLVSGIGRADTPQQIDGEHEPRDLHRKDGVKSQVDIPEPISVAVFVNQVVHVFAVPAVEEPPRQALSGGRVAVEEGVGVIA